MVVGGPNARSDFHIDPGEELFLQLEGDIELAIVENGKQRSISIKQGELFLLPAGIPHSPRRPANTVGLVVEQKRGPGELDGLRWYCHSCNAVVHEQFFELTDIEAQLEAIIVRYRDDEALRTCAACGHVQSPD
jgi:3-hydroxyanthranilate 3,4-dioxygenase